MYQLYFKVQLINLAEKPKDIIKIFEEYQPARTLPLRRILVGVYAQFNTIEDVKSRYEFQNNIVLKKLHKPISKNDKREKIFWTVEGESINRHTNLTGLYLKGLSGDVS